MTTRQMISDRLQRLESDESVALRTYDHLTEDTWDPTARVVLGVLARDATQDRALLRGISAGALDMLESTNTAVVDGARGIAEINAVSHAAVLRAQDLGELACRNEALAMRHWRCCSRRWLQIVRRTPGY